MEGHWKFLGGERVLEAKFIEEMYEINWHFLGAGGAKQKPSVGVGGVRIFSATAHSQEN